MHRYYLYIHGKLAYKYYIASAYREFTAEQIKIGFCRYRLVASKVFSPTGFGQAEFPIGYKAGKSVAEPR